MNNTTSVRAYLDTNLFNVMYERNISNSEKVILSAEKAMFTPIISYHTLNEIVANLKARYSKDAASIMLMYIWSLPELYVVQKDEIQKFEGTFDDLVEDADDIPHIHAYFASKSNYFVTNNRRLTRMKIMERVNFKNPKEFLEEILKVESYNTPNGI